ncbi:hypothetical protein [Gloeothece verrucosa]|uniref:Uncharacterized protein n=1 Tax=Gloeothece verrucosa (strain PCC 7822) TaxID=497965 RepID=E0U6Y5_GLOV7|nr:hypothetical protein [Gloeothece verrucosa]ADN16022.1 hypothetical protein Cyan7822_4102 [Gloeothece verrucosa PCC 7822]ADN16470.1 hypothetical protein Cyan7822_4561 [Gloeothece verrucosa PCC 7822]
MPCNCKKCAGNGECQKIKVNGVELIPRTQDADGNMFVVTVNGVSGVVFKKDLEQQQ